MLIQADKSLLFRHERGIMHRRIRDNATPKTGGVTNRAYPTVTLRFELGISNFGPVSDFEIRVSHFPISVGPYYAKRTQSPLPKTQICKTNPISAYPASRRPCFCKTNPLSLYGHGTPCPKKYETNPIPPETPTLRTTNYQL